MDEIKTTIYGEPKDTVGKKRNNDTFSDDLTKILSLLTGEYKNLFFIF